MSANQNIDAAGIASEFLCCSLKTFHNKKPRLEALGFPAPLAVPGHPIWVREEIEAWFASRRRTSPVPAPAPAPAQPVKRGRGRPRKLAEG